MGSGLVTIAEFGDSLGAEMFKVRLEQEGVKAIVVGDTLMTIMPKVGLPHVDVQVCVEDKDLAKAILADYQAEIDRARDDEMDKENSEGGD